MNAYLHRRTTGIAVAVVAALSLSACGGDGEPAESSDPLDHYLKTEDAKTSSSVAASKSSSPGSGSETATPPASTSGTAATSSAPAPPPASESDPLKPTSKSQVSRATKHVDDFIKAFNAAARKPSTASSLDQYYTASCDSCKGLKRIVTDLAKDKNRLDGDLASFRRGTVERDSGRDSLRIFGDWSQRRTAVLNAKGKTIAHAPAEPPVLRAFIVDTAGGSPKITAINVGVER